jgi:hypothetical protein
MRRFDPDPVGRLAILSTLIGGGVVVLTIAIPQLRHVP